MDTTELALIVAAITGGSAVVQGIVQGALTARSARVAARQQAVRANIELLQRLQVQLAELGQAANVYMIGVVFEADFFTAEGWNSKRRQPAERLQEAHGNTYASIHALPVKSPARGAALDATNLIETIMIHGDPKDLNSEWKQGNRKIATALEAVGLALREQYKELQEVTHGPATRSARWALNRLQNLFRPNTGEEVKNSIEVSPETFQVTGSESFMLPTPDTNARTEYHD
ncbi:hypothetical protein [Kutzneria chonburiensis]|uniref:Uncharacterized protein n=1 Tax=Kutzneria chonburiensis TaxID=1483604 RepID=A0ABV6MZM0_9PSEU|nr:hypothetical protein [Kutzneria chonburiensis]